MANANVPGFWPVKDMGSGPITHRRVQVDSGYGTGIFTGDVVLPISTGYWNVQGTAGTGNPIGSVSTGASYVNADGNRVGGPYLPASTTYSGALDAENASFIYIVEQAMLVTFEGQLNAAPTGIADIQENVAIVLTAAGSTVTGLSGTDLNYSTHATTTNQFRIYGFVNRPNNDPTLTRAKVYVRINEGVEAGRVASATGSAGI